MPSLRSTLNGVCVCVCGSEPVAAGELALVTRRVHVLAQGGAFFGSNKAADELERVSS